MLGPAIETLLVGLFASFAITPLVIRLGRMLGAVDAPGPRKVHAAPVPRIGGLAVFAGFATAAVFAAFATGYISSRFPQGGGYWGTLAVGAGCMLLLGFVDDVLGVSFVVKFSVQFLAAAAAWLAGFRIEAVAIPFTNLGVELGWASPFVTVLWIVGITNAMNLIDGLDGLAAGSALITTSTLALIAFHAGRVAVGAVCLALAGSLLGFLIYTFNPAKIFLGDSGSMFLGFVLAVVSVYGSQKRPAVVATLVPLLVLGVPIFDTSLAIIRRLGRLLLESREAGRGLRWAARNAKIVFLPDRGHLHHRLLDLGASHRLAVLLLYLAGIAMAAIALAEIALSSRAATLVLVGTLGVISCLVLVAYRGARSAKAREKRPLIRPGGVLEERR